MYIDKIFPFLKNSDLIRCVEQIVSINDIYIPIKVDDNVSVTTDTDSNKIFKAYRVMPCDILVINEDDSVAKRIKTGFYGSTVKLVVFEVDYMSVVDRISVDTVDGVLSATIKVNDAYEKEEIVSDVLINYASNGIKVDKTMLDEEDIEIEVKESESFRDWMDNFDIGNIHESDEFFNKLMDKKDKGESISGKVVGTGKDAVYNWLDSYFALPENVDMTNGGREVVPLLIGPTAVFKSATVKELCRKYNFRLVDFRVSFTSRLDYSGLFQIGDMDDAKFSYACPMEEIVTCSDGFREYCRKAYDKVSEILQRDYLEENKASDGENTDSNHVPLSDEQRNKLTDLLSQYKEYMKTPVLFFDEITRTSDAGVEGVLVQLLNQKKFNNLTLNGCKFVAATNLNLDTDSEHILHKDQLDTLYDVKQDIDVAYSNRFMPLQVLPEDVKDRWFEWAESTKTRNGKDVTSIHPMILSYLKSRRGKDKVYNDKPVLQAIDDNLSENEIKSQTFPNYRTWDMLSEYLYSIDDEYELALKEDSGASKVYRDTIIEGLISKWAAEDFIKYLIENGYKQHEEVADDVGDFMESTLAAGVPALLIGPSSLGKTSRVNAYRKKVEKRTGLKPELINVNLASKDTTDLMGYPVKQSLVKYVCGNDLDKLGLGSVSKDLQEIVEGVSANTEYGMTDYLTRRAPDLDIKKKFKKALDEGREVILFFDECNRVQDKTVMSAMFECFTGENTVKLLDGRTLTMSELYEEAENGNTDLWTYSVTEEGDIIPAHISCVIKKNPTKKIVEIEMEDGSIVRCTEDHKFMLKDGSYVMAKDLDETMEIMEVESRDSTKSDMKRVEGYEIVSTNANNKENFTHRIVAESCNGWHSGCGKVIHHKDFNKRNNNPENLDCSMTYFEHIKYHGEHLDSFKEMNGFEEKRLKALREYYNDVERVEKANIKRKETFTQNTEKWEERNRKISETRRKKCEESDDYRRRISAAFIRYNEKVKSGEIVRDYSYLEGKRPPLEGEKLEKLREHAREMAAKHWSTEESHKEQSERMKLLNQREDFKEMNRQKTARMNKDPDFKVKQQIGKIKKIVEDAVKIGDFSKELYELVRLDKYRHGVPAYDKAEETLRKAGISFDLIIQEVL